ncbi:MAG: hypothetical protein E7588_07040 [Ruminococcaceae bacterium]|nr:hypothetical protein [Oscillospiraceae bacterium]
MKFNFSYDSKMAESIKLLIIVLLFISMLWMFVSFTEIKLGSFGILASTRNDSFPADKMWVFSENSVRTQQDRNSSPYVFPSSITFRSGSLTYSVEKQKSMLVSVYNDVVMYISEFLGSQYNGIPTDYDEYLEVLKNNNYTLLRYNSELSAYVLKLYCDSEADGYYNGDFCNISKILMTEDDNGRLIAYSMDSAGAIMKFIPVSQAQATAYPVNSAVISAYTGSKVIVPSILSFESDFFANQTDNVSPDIPLQSNMQFYEAGISNPLSFISSLTQSDSMIKNDRILSILKSFKMNTGLVRHYVDKDIIYFVESNAALALSADGYMTYNAEEGGIPLYKVLDKQSDSFSVSDKLNAALTLVGGFSGDIIGGNGELMLSKVNYNKENDIMRFEFTYSFDSIPFYGLDRITLEIGSDSVIRAHIPTYSIYRNSVRKITLISPEIAFRATPVSNGKTVIDYKPGYVISKNGKTANASWIAVT